MKKYLFILAILLVGLAGCSSDETTEDTSTDEVSNEVVEEEVAEEEVAETSSGDFEEYNKTGGSEVELVASNVGVITNADGNSILDSTKDDFTDTLDGTGVEINTAVYDTDGDGIITGETDDADGEAYTVVVELKNVSGQTLTLQNLDLYLQEAVDETIDFEIISDDVDTDKFEIKISDYITYKDDETYDQITFEDGATITYVATQNVGSAYEDEVTAIYFEFIATPEEGESFSVNLINDYVGVDQFD